MKSELCKRSIISIYLIFWTHYVSLYKHSQASIFPLQEKIKRFYITSHKKGNFRFFFQAYARDLKTKI